jgi:regulator of cell morphogenesis and NO signaling
MQALQDFNKTVSDIVRADYRTADVFKSHGINYCCGGKVPLQEACEAKGLDYTKLVQELEQATQTISLPNNLQFNNWKIDFLIDYIVNIHHAYLRDRLPRLEASLISFANSHKKQYPYLQKVVEAFTAIASAVLTHNQHEEEVIFPYIKQIANAYSRKESYGNLFVRTLRKPLSNIEGEHKKIGELLNSLRALTNHYTFPETACTNYRVIFQKLREFDNDMMQHIHLENNILFLKAIEMERELLLQ